MDYRAADSTRKSRAPRPRRRGRSGATALTVGQNTRSTQYRTRFEERVQSEYAIFAPDPRLLETAKWGQRLMRCAIDDNASSLQLSGHPLRMIYVGREHVGLQPVAGVIGNRDSFGLVAIGDDTEHRPEDLLARNPHLVGDMREYRRPHEPAALQPVGAPLAAGQQNRAFVYAEADIRLDPFPLLLAHHGADLHLGICRGADLEGLDMALQLY